MKKQIICLILLVLGLGILLGSLFYTMHSNEPVWFIYGYPIAGLCLLIAYPLIPKN